MNGKRYILVLALIIIGLIFLTSETAYGALKRIDINKVRLNVEDTQNQILGGDVGSSAYHTIYHNYAYSTINMGWEFGVKDWTSPEGVEWDYIKCGPGILISDEQYIKVVRFPDDNELIHRYMRYTPPTVIVNGLVLSEPWPRPGDYIAPDKIPGTADICVESKINTPIGATIRRRTFAYSTGRHDNYIIKDWKIINTGNTDEDEDIELDGQTFDSLFFWYVIDWDFMGTFGQACWTGYTGARPEADSLRYHYTYDDWERDAAFDDFGKPDPETGFLRRAPVVGVGLLYADSSVDNRVNDLTQPRMTCSGDLHMTFGPGAESWKTAVELMKPHYYFYKIGPKAEGCGGLSLQNAKPPYIHEPVADGGLDWDVYPDTYHTMSLEQMGWAWECPHTWNECILAIPPNYSFNYSSHSVGPYDIPFGDSIHIITVAGYGSISRKTGWQIGTDWKNGECTWDGPNKLPPVAPVVYDAFGDQWAGGLDSNNIAKDNWVSLGLDSLRDNMWAAQWAANNNFDVPIPPPPPDSFIVNSGPEAISLHWGNQSEDAADFAGYRIYRAKGTMVYEVTDGTVTGDWEMIFECGEGTGNALTHDYEDTDVISGTDYYYAVTAFDDGTNPPGVTGVSEVLESSRVQCRTTEVASLLTPPSEDLSNVRVVPNPWNYRAEGLQYPGAFRKINFVNIPGICTIRIYNESGDLMTVLEHDDGSGTQAWKTEQGGRYMTTETGQYVESGLYIAYIETPDGENTTVKFLIVR